MDEKSWLVKLALAFTVIVTGAIAAPLFEALSSKMHDLFMSALKDVGIRKHLIMQSVFGVIVTVITSIFILDATWKYTTIVAVATTVSTFGYNAFIVLVGMMRTKVIDVADKADLTKLAGVKHIVKTPRDDNDRKDQKEGSTHE